MALHCLSGQRKPLVELLISALKILLVPMRLIKPASHRLRGEGLTNLIDTSINHLSRIKLVSGIRNTGFQFSGIMVSSGKNIHFIFVCHKQPSLSHKHLLQKPFFSFLYLSSSCFAEVIASS